MSNAPTRITNRDSDYELSYTFYECQENSDLTEGRGQMKTFAYFFEEDDAVEKVQGHGVMGVGPGDVLETNIYHKIGGYSNLIVIRTKVYGYREDWTGAWSYGFMDLREAPDKDPEWDEFQRLLKKFMGMKT